MRVQVAESNFQDYIGQEAEPTRVARFPVDRAMIRQWVEALGDDNPLYVDAAVAIAHGRAEVIAPPAMISTWIMSGYRRYRQVQQLRESAIAEDTAYSRLMNDLDERGFTSVVATDIEQNYHEEVSPGAHVSAHYLIDAVSPLKRTALGDGHFITLRKEYVDQEGRSLVTEMFRMLRFAPTRAATPPRHTGVPHLVRTQDNSFWFEGAAEGRLLIQRCADCGELRHPPGPACPVCRSFRWDSIEASGMGALHSWTVVHHPQDAAFRYPLAVALIDLDEGTRLVADIEMLPEAGPTIGDRVHIVFGEHAHGEILPRVRFGEPDEGPGKADEAPQPVSDSDGFALPIVRIPLDRTAIMAGAIASQDFEEVHHDPGRARDRGMRDIFLSINTTNGLVDRFLTDWGGPSMRIHSVSLRLGVPQFAGDALEFAGVACTRSDERTRVDVTGRNSDGVHVTAIAIVSGVSIDQEER